jgi:glycosyltransferase involved in cell wall biosynthesis
MSDGVPARRPVLVVAGRDPLEERSGGHSSYVRAHARALRAAGFEPHLFGVSRSGGTVETPFGHVHRLRTRLPRRQMLVMLHAPRLARALVRFARGRPGPHAIHSFGVWGYAGALAARALARAGTRVVSVTSGYTAYAEETGSKALGVSAAHGAAARVRFLAEHAWVLLALGRYEREAYEAPGRVLLNYESVRAMLGRRYRLGSRARRVPYASEVAFDRDGGLADDGGRPASTPEAGLPPHVVCVSRHEPRKGIDVLLRALAVLRDRGVPFRATVASEGPLLSAHRRLAAELGLGDSVRLPGFVPDVAALLRAADVYVLPSHREHSGSVALLEALEAGTAVVATRCDGIPEDVEDGRTGVLVPPGDPQALAAAVGTLLRDPARRAALGAAARALHEERFRPEAFAASLRREYESLGVRP